MDLYSSPPQTDLPKDLEHQWREWIKQETIRRVIWMMFFYDTLSCLEMGVPPSICFPEVAVVPIPAPDTIWQARSAADWRFALTTYRPATLDQAMRFHFHLRPGQDSQSAHQESPKDVCMLVCTDFGPFGRLVMVISLLRALLQIGQAQVRVEDSVIQTWARSLSTPEEQKLTMCTAVPLFGVALKRVSPRDEIFHVCSLTLYGNFTSGGKGGISIQCALRPLPAKRIATKRLRQAATASLKLRLFFNLSDPILVTRLPEIRKRLLLRTASLMNCTADYRGKPFSTKVILISDVAAQISLKVSFRELQRHFRFTGLLKLFTIFWPTILLY